MLWHTFSWIPRYTFLALSFVVSSCAFRKALKSFSKVILTSLVVSVLIAVIFVRFALNPHSASSAFLREVSLNLVLLLKFLVFCIVSSYRRPSSLGVHVVSPSGWICWLRLCFVHALKLHPGHFIMRDSLYPPVASHRVNPCAGWWRINPVPFSQVPHSPQPFVPVHLPCYSWCSVASLLLGLSLLTSLRCCFQLLLS